MYYSRTMTSNQRAYPVREQEALAIYETFKKAEYLLLGSKFQIISLTDHHTLQQLTNPESHVSAKRLILQGCCMSECLSIVTRTQTGEVYQVHRVDVECKLSAISREIAIPFILHLI